MKWSFIDIIRHLYSTNNKGNTSTLEEYFNKTSSISKRIMDKKDQGFISELKVKDLVHYSLPSIDSNEIIIDSLKSFQKPFKLSVLVMEESQIVGTLNLSDVIANLNASKVIYSRFGLQSQVRCIMSHVFVPLEFTAKFSDIILDILNCESQIHPVFKKGRLKGVLYKDTILDILKIQMLEEVVQI